MENGGCLEPVPLGDQPERPKTENVVVREGSGNPRVFALFQKGSLITKNPTVADGVFMVDQAGRTKSNSLPYSDTE